MGRNPFLTVSVPLPWDVYLRRDAASLPFPLQWGAGRLFTRARQGLFEGLRRLGLGLGDAALVPAYHHGSEIEAYVQAGLSLRYYEAAPDLAPSLEELEARLDPSVRVLHLTHYLGFAQDVPRWRDWCDRHDMFLIEDAAQGWLGSLDERPLGTWGDLALFSVYKSVGVPDGGAVALRGRMLSPTGKPPWGARASIVKHVAWLAARVETLGAWRSRRRGPRYEAEADFAMGEPNAAATAATSFFLPKLVGTPVATVRRRHYRRLLAELGESVPQPFRKDPSGSSPFAFPIFVGDKGRSAAVLLDHGIRAVDAWSVPHPTLPVDAFPGAARRRGGVLLLPVHQELRPSDLDRIIHVARVAAGRSRS